MANTIQTGIKSHTKDMTKYSLFMGGLDVTSKSLGSNTPVNVVRATFDGLVNMKDAESVAKLRGVSVQHLAE